MSAVGTKLTETFGSLDPIKTETLETTCSDTLATNFPEKPPEVDANGWPIGYGNPSRVVLMRTTTGSRLMIPHQNHILVNDRYNFES